MKLPVRSPVLAVLATTPVLFVDGAPEKRGLCSTDGWDVTSKDFGPGVRR